MLKSIIVASALLAACATPAFASPVADDPAAPATPTSLSARLGDSIHHASDRASGLLANALSAIGVPYRRGGNSAETGFDCSGFVRTTFEQALGLMLPRRSQEQAAATEKIDKKELQPGDLVFFNTLRRAYSHVGIYLGEGKFIHAPRTGARVRVESMDVSYWQKRFNGARRVLDDKAVATTAVSTDPAATPVALRASSVLTRDTPAPSAVRLGGSASRATSEPAREAVSPVDDQRANMASVMTGDI
ncbi:MAG: C40 family peptidase [Burkholderiales bacterium]|nr:C40 family peptidase [Burkholderiales bacterium]